mmetsp:Transcript_8624/g.24648  ORF Transcript_8624/g.24648 Transcript_8624/m.24648 type:complete len:125 (-) Transcript_8624:819-1193(-)
MSITACFSLCHQFSGPVPASLGNAANLTFLSLERQWPGFSGPMPPELGQLSKLQQLTLAYNQLSGMLPDTLSGWRSVKYLDLRNNNFDKHLPLLLLHQAPLTKALALLILTDLETNLNAYRFFT